MGLLDGEVALVTGASSGIGADLARMLAGHGAGVALAARREEAVRGVADEVEAVGGTALVVPTDVGHDEDLIALAQRVRQEWVLLTSWSTRPALRRTSRSTS